MRPLTLDSFAGQAHLVGQGKSLREAIVAGQLHSMVFWGPPGVGKTTLAKIIAESVDAHLEAISAVLSGVKEIRAAVARAEEERDIRGRKTILFVDEVHRFNKSQQDAFLPYVEDGTVVLIGATTENPSFELNNALLSRCRVYISALHKAVRGSSPDAALYWFVRMIDGGCDPLYIARRVVRMASEDIGNADPRALSLSLNAWDTQERLGSPEGELSIAQAIMYLAAAPKSNAVYSAFNTARADIQSMPTHEVPLHLRNAPTKLMKELDYGAEYRYAHNEPGGFVPGENYFPQELQDKRYYFPTDRGLEQKISEKLEYLKQLNESSPEQRYSGLSNSTQANPKRFNPKQAEGEE
ncbi:UNVERIFIED_CONTAM: hypothetical protein GTU68_060040 [Idotea baltica]|nr:hypothetical protein [Idotea baltica]